MEIGRRHTDPLVEELTNKIIKVELDLSGVITEVERLKRTISTSDKQHANAISKMEIQISRLTEVLNGLVAQFNTLVEGERATHAVLDTKVATIQTQQSTIIDKLDKLSFDLVEPMEVYKTAKYGVKAGVWIKNIVVWLTPIIATFGGIYYTYMNK